jgi:hypothetical protein
MEDYLVDREGYPDAMGAFVKGTRPEINAPDFNRYEKSKKSKTI